MAKHADVIVVGNAIYENLKQALETVKGCKRYVLRSNNTLKYKIRTNV